MGLSVFPTESCEAEIDPFIEKLKSFGCTNVVRAQELAAITRIQFTHRGDSSYVIQYPKVKDAGEPTFIEFGMTDQQDLKVIEQNADELYEYLNHQNLNRFTKNSMLPGGRMYASIALPADALDKNILDVFTRAVVAPSSHDDLLKALGLAKEELLGERGDGAYYLEETEGAVYGIALQDYEGSFVNATLQVFYPPDFLKREALLLLLSRQNSIAFHPGATKMTRFNQMESLASQGSYQLEAMCRLNDAQYEKDFGVTFCAMELGLFIRAHIPIRALAKPEMAAMYARRFARYGGQSFGRDMVEFDPETDQVATTPIMRPFAKHMYRFVDIAQP